MNLDASLDAAVKKIFAGRRSPQQHMVLAVSSEDPDVRRDAVTEIADSKKYDQEWAIKGFVAIALLEDNAQTRCVAIRALARTGDPRAVDTMLKILHAHEHPKEVFPPDALARWDATKALADLSARDLVPEEHKTAVHETLLDRLRLDSDRHVRLAAARGLGCYPSLASVEVLIMGLRDEDFAVAHQCETSLVKLTGHTHDANALAWEEWVAQNRDELFADAGHVPPSRMPPYSNRWEKFSYETKDLIRWLWPGEKEE